jgi:hypothetical protein
MMQTGYRYKRPPATTAHHHFSGSKSRPDNRHCRIEYARKCGCVSEIQKTFTRLGHLLDELDVVGRVEQFNVGPACVFRDLQPHFLWQAAFVQAAKEGSLPIRAERVTISESVPGDSITGQNRDGIVFSWMIHYRRNLSQWP